MTETLQVKRNDALLKMIDLLETETSKEPINTLSVSALSQAIKVVSEIY